MTHRASIAIPVPAASRSLIRLLPGLALALVIAVVALLVAALSWARDWGLSALTLAIAGGLLAGHTVYPVLSARYRQSVRWNPDPGIQWSKQHLLRLGIVLFGLRLSFQDIAAVGWAGLLADATVLLSTFALAVWLGRRWLGLDEQTAMLIGAGSSICGAAAVLATEPVVKAPAEKVAVAVATVVVFGTLAMLLYPALYALAHVLARQFGTPDVSAWAFGIYTGSTVHEVAQVAAVGNAIGAEAANGAVIAKMLRVLMLAPFLLGLSWWLARRAKPASSAVTGTASSEAQAEKPRQAALVVPWFALGFIAMAGLRSLDLVYGLMPAALLNGLLWFDTLLLATAMAALGLGTHVNAIRRAGSQPLLLAALLFVWLVAGGALINAAAHLLLC